MELTAIYVDRYGKIDNCKLRFSIGIYSECILTLFT